MAEYIEREAELREAESRIMLGASAAAVYESILDVPAADVAPVRHGKWEWDTEDIYRCSNCAQKSRVKEVMGRPAWGYCPNCGAMMEGGSDG